MARSVRLFVATAALSLLGLAACTPAPASAPASALPEVLTEHMAALFDNSIDPAALGLALSASPQRRDDLMERARNAEYVVRARIGTVTTEGAGSDTRYNIVLKVEGEPIAGPKPPSDTFNIVLAPENPAYNLARSRDLRMAGIVVIAFLHRFTTPQGEVLRWSLAQDNEHTLEAVRQALLLSTVRGGGPEGASP